MAILLCVDDEPKIGEVIARSLASAGHAPVVVRSVPEALEALARAEAEAVVLVTARGSNWLPTGSAQAMDLERLRCENEALRRELDAVRASRVTATPPGTANGNGGNGGNGAPGAGANGGPHVVLHSLNVQEAERVLIRHALDAASQNRTRAAALLGISVRTLRNKLNGRPAPIAP
jgi:DNA-binding NtrC family response regulator